MSHPATAPRSTCAHELSVYDDETAAARWIAAFLRPGFERGTALVIAAPPLRQAIGRELAHPLSSRGQLVLLDREETLRRVLVDDAPDVDALSDAVGPVLDEALRRGGPVRVYGDMVVSLWEAGRVTEAIQLEDHWNLVAPHRHLDLCCAYPATLFSGPRGDVALHALAARHSSTTLPPDLRLTRAAGATTVGWRLDRHRGSGRAARDQVRALLGSRDGQAADTVALLTTELVNNAVLHAGSDARVIVRTSPHTPTVRVEVTDLGTGVLRPGRPGPGATSGRGLLLVEELADAWGSTQADGAKTVWFEIAC
jgi:anti-sigma regulatory factor (Ser/Thr protein kinase)